VISAAESACGKRVAHSASDAGVAIANAHRRAAAGEAAWPSQVNRFGEHPPPFVEPTTPAGPPRVGAVKGDAAESGN
jgi:hypothetical protein